MAHDQATFEVTSSDQHRFELIYVGSDDAIWRLLMVPAMGISARNYIIFAKQLAQLGAEVFIHEWRGLGSSSLRASRTCDWGYRELLMDLEGSLEKIKAQGDGRANTPLVVAGHSLGSQLALLLQAIRPESINGTVCIAGGAPFYKAFPFPMRSALRVMFWVMPWLAQRVGHYPGYRLGFAGREARSVMQDWAMSGRTGRYEPAGVGTNLEQAMAEITQPILGVVMADDWFVPPGSLQYLLDKAPHAQVLVHQQGRSGLTSGLTGKADHYRWMKEPKTTALAIADWVGQSVLQT